MAYPGGATHVLGDSRGQELVLSSSGSSTVELPAISRPPSPSDPRYGAIGPGLQFGKLTNGRTNGA
jgi:hypothetical protein